MHPSSYHACIHACNHACNHACILSSIHISRQVSHPHPCTVTHILLWGVHVWESVDVYRVGSLKGDLKHRRPVCVKPMSIWQWINGRSTSGPAWECTFSIDYPGGKQFDESLCVGGKRYTQYKPILSTLLMKFLLIMILFPINQEGMQEVYCTCMP